MLRLTLAQMRLSLPRLVAAGLAILLGSAFVTTTLVSGDAITRGGYDAVTASYGAADLVVEPLDDDLGKILEAVRTTPGVATAEPLLLGWSTFSSGRRTVSQMLVSAPSEPSLASLEVVRGAAPTAADEVALPASTAERLGVGVGDTLRVEWTTWPDELADGTGDDPTAPVEPVEHTADVTVVGVVDDPYGAWAQFGGAGTALAESIYTWIDSALDEDYSSSTLVAVADGADVAQVQDAVAQNLDSAYVMTRDEAAVRSVEEYGAGNVIVMLALGFAAVALLVAALVISNTFQVLVAQRTRMLALLRCVGARRRQVRTSVLLEAGMLGLVSGAGGVLVGLGLAQGALSILSRTQDGVPLPTSIVPTATHVLVPVAVSVVVTVLAALVPARAATRVAPVAALRPADAPSVHARPGRVRLAISALLAVGGVAVLVGAILLARSDRAIDEMLVLGIGVLGGAASFVGLLVGAPLWIPHVAAAVGRPVARISTSARLAAANAVRNPRRTAATSSALVIGVTLVVMMSTGATSARISIAREMDARTPIDMIVGGDGAVLPDRVAEDVAGLDDVEQVVGVGLGRILNGGQDYSEIDALVLPDDSLDVLRDRTTAEVLASGRSIVPSWWAGGERTVEARVERTAVIEVEPTTTDTVLLSEAAGEALGFPDLPTTMLLVRLDDDADAASVLGEVQDVVADDGLPVVSAAAARQQNEQAIDVVLAVVVGLLGVAVVIALIGVANTLSLSVIERRRESATLRAVGLSRRGLRWMLATEGMLIAGVGALIGTVLGLLYGWAGTAVVFGTLGDVQLTVPWGHVGAVLAVALLAGLAASVLPARAAARTPPVAALGVD